VRHQRISSACIAAAEFAAETRSVRAELEIVKKTATAAAKRCRSPRVECLSLDWCVCGVCSVCRLKLIFRSVTLDRFLNYT